MEKTTVFNLIILDESGSMSSAWNSTINGCNETINVARTIQKNHPDTQRCLMSIYAFQSGGVPSRYLCKNVPVGEVKDVTKKDYEPMGCTPLLDAVGSTLTDLMAVASTHEDASAIITIITDGYENSSTQYNWKQVAALISQAKEKGWTVNLIGANIDVEDLGNMLHVDNRMNFESDEQGTKMMFRDFNNAMVSYEEDRICCEKEMSMPQRVESRTSKSKKFFRF